MAAPWEARVRFVRQDDRLVASELQVRPITKIPVGGLTKGDLRSVDLYAVPGVPDPSVIYLRGLWDIKWNRPKLPEPGKHKSADFFAGVAWHYLYAFERDSHHPLVVMQADYGGPRRVSRETLRDWIHGARRHGYLETATKPGVAQGGGTKKLSAWVEKQRKEGHW
jgi:hypothetical protein